MLDDRGEGGVLEGVGGLRGIPCEPIDGDGMGGKGWESCCIFRVGLLTFDAFSSIVRLDPSEVVSSNSSDNASKPLDPVLL